MINLFENKKVLIPILLVWIAIGTLFIYRVPFDRPGPAHDFWGHIGYTDHIARNHSLPNPIGWWEAPQAPLYYFINSFMLPKSLLANTVTGKTAHINFVRGLSVLYGAIVLIIFSWFLTKFNFNPFIQVLVLLFTITTPAFIIVFSTYNNDSLAMMLSVILLFLSYKLYYKWSWKIAPLLLLVATAAVYTKISAAIAHITISLFCCRNFKDKKLPSSTELKIVGILALAIILLFPWARFHNYKHTGKYLPSYNYIFGVKTKFGKEEFKTVLGVVFRIPKWQSYKPDLSHEWDDPFCHPFFEAPNIATKRYDYLAYTLLTMTIDTYKYVVPAVGFVWAILFLHLIAFIIALREIFKSTINKLCGFIIFTSHFLAIVFILPVAIFTPGPQIDYRYISWGFLPWIILYASVLSKEGKLSSILRRVFTLCIIVQIYFLITLVSVWE